MDGKYFTSGIKLIFYGETNPITFGNLDGTNWTKAIFKNLNKSKLSSVQKNEHMEDVRSEIFLFLVQMANIPKNGQNQMVVSLNLY